MKDGTLKYTPKNAKSRTKVTFSSMKRSIQSTNAKAIRNVRLLKTSYNQRVNKIIFFKKKTFFFFKNKKKSQQMLSESSFIYVYLDHLKIIQII